MESDILHPLRRWFCKKYNIPPTDPRFQSYTIEELLLEYIEDQLEAGTLTDAVDEEGKIISDPVLRVLEEEFEIKENEGGGIVVPLPSEPVER